MVCKHCDRRDNFGAQKSFRRPERNITQSETSHSELLRHKVKYVEVALVKRPRDLCVLVFVYFLARKSYHIKNWSSSPYLTS